MKTKLYKWTDSNDMTTDKTCWGKGVSHSVSAPYPKDLCCRGWLHAYRDPRIAVLMDIRGAFYSPEGHLWMCEGVVGLEFDILDCGCSYIKTIRRIEPPRITLRQLVKLSLKCIEYDLDLDEGVRLHIVPTMLKCLEDGLLYPDREAIKLRRIGVMEQSLRRCLDFLTGRPFYDTGLKDIIWSYTASLLYDLTRRVGLPLMEILDEVIPLKRVRYVKDA